MSVIPNLPDPYDEWLHAPLGVTECGDPRFEVRRCTTDEYERIWDCVDEAFGVKRPREVFDWLYRRNPMGRARCWVLLERETGRFLKTSTSYPWPVWRGHTPLRGSLGADAATVPDWQRKGLSKIRRPVTRSHPWFGKVCGIAGPNEGSRAVSRSAGREETLLGDLPGAVAVLRAAPALEKAGAPAALARLVGTPAGALLSGYRRMALRAARRTPGRVEPVARFDADFDEVTLRCLDWPEFWCPHNADFLNWRYLDHPRERYVALAVVENERPQAYAVLRLDAGHAVLTEIAVAPDDRARAAALLSACFESAEQAGCAFLAFFATPGLPQWRHLWRAGFVATRTRNHFEAACRDLEPEVTDIRRWQAGPGDRDYH